MSRIRERLKSVLDRRYVTKQELAQIITGLQAFLATEDPQAVRKKLDEAHRLTMETARAVETMLEQEVKLWQARLLRRQTLRESGLRL